MAGGDTPDRVDPTLYPGAVAIVFRPIGVKQALGLVVFTVLGFVAVVYPDIVSFIGRLEIALGGAILWSVAVRVFALLYPELVGHKAGDLE